MLTDPAPINRVTAANILGNRGDAEAFMFSCKKLEGASRADRAAQFHFISGCAKSFQNQGEPVISIDAKKKELIGDVQELSKLSRFRI